MITDTYLDYLSPKEREFRSRYNQNLDFLLASDARMVNAICNKMEKWNGDRKFVRNLARDVMKCAGDRSKKNRDHADYLLYEAWLWGQSVK